MAVLHELCRRLTEFVRFLVETGGAISRNVFAAPAQQIAHRHAGNLALEIPQRKVDPGEAHQTKAPTHLPPGGLIHQPPNGFGMQGVLAQQKISQVDADVARQHVARGTVRGDIGVNESKARVSLIGPDLHDQGLAPHRQVGNGNAGIETTHRDFGNFHGCAPDCFADYCPARQRSLPLPHTGLTTTRAPRCRSQ